MQWWVCHFLALLQFGNLQMILHTSPSIYIHAPNPILDVPYKVEEIDSAFKSSRAAKEVVLMVCNLTI